jgi:thioredoxin reductase (NADPH)
VILHRGDELEGQASYRRQVEESGVIEVRYRTVVEAILGEEQVRGVRVRDQANDAVEELEVGAVFPFVGLSPSTERFREHVAVDADGAVLTDDVLRTTAVGVLAAGIVRSGAAARAAAVAGEGAAAAIAATAFLEDGSWRLEPSPAAAHSD